MTEDKRSDKNTKQEYQARLTTTNSVSHTQEGAIQ
jgi:hypothetical protein